jgi:hypothetical protein
MRAISDMTRAKAAIAAAARDTSDRVRVSIARSRGTAVAPGACPRTALLRPALALCDSADGRPMAPLGHGSHTDWWT